MATYQITTSAAVEGLSRRYPKLDWPIDGIAVGQAFIVPLRDGSDHDGRPEAYLRVLADKAGKRLGRKFSCRKIDGALAISRIA